MTRARAIELLKGIQFCCDFDDCTNAWDCDECVDAFNMAIEALEQEPTAEYSSDVISRQAAIDAVNKNRDSVFHDSVHYEDAVYDISNLPSAFAVEQKGEPMGDVISRRVVVECVYKALRTPPLKGTFTDTMSLAISMVNELPSAQPFTEEQIQTMQELESAQIEKAFELGKADRPTGHWIYDVEAYPCGNPYGHYDCDQCGESVPYKTNFCPNCGCAMKGGEEE